MELQRGTSKLRVGDLFTVPGTSWHFMVNSNKKLPETAWRVKKISNEQILLVKCILDGFLEKHIDYEECSFPIGVLIVMDYYLICRENVPPINYKGNMSGGSLC